jgi:spermidine synthase
MGMAYGALKAGQWIEAQKNLYRCLQYALLKMLIGTYVSVPIISMISAAFNKLFAIMMGYAAVGILAYFSGSLLPLLCQISISKDEKNKGTSVSYIYFFNIVGATCGSLITSFLFLDIFSLTHTILLCCGAILFLLAVILTQMKAILTLKIAFATSFIMILVSPIIFHNSIGKLQGFSEIPKYLSENRHGIITVLASTPSDIIFGNGAYDGKFNIDPLEDSNNIRRAYMLAALHPHPKRILEIGLSSGSWGRVFTLYHPLQELVSIDINPGYKDIIRHYPSIAPLLKVSKWTHYTDDGRRWLRRHPHERFDAIVMNTTFYWRANATSLLSEEFLNLCRQHLNPGGIIYYNTTDARDSIFTAAHVFKHVVVYNNLVAAGDQPFSMTYEERKKNLLNFVNEQGQPLFSFPNMSRLLEDLASNPLPDIQSSILTEKQLWRITDDNLAPEYKIQHAFF